MQNADIKSIIKTIPTTFCLHECF